MRRPTPLEIEHCTRLELTSRDDRDPNHIESRWAAINTDPSFHNPQSDADPISIALMSCRMNERASSHQLLLTNYNSKFGKKNGPEFFTMNRVVSRESDSLTPEELSVMWQIGLKTAKNTILATTQKCVRSTGMLTRRFKTDKSQLRYRQLSCHYDTFYVDFLKIGVKSIRGYIGGMLYCNKLGFKKFFPCTSETQDETSHSLRSFIEIIGLPTSLHSDNHNILMTGKFKRTL